MWQQLASEIWEQILIFLPPNEKGLFSIQISCKQLYFLTSDEKLWEKIYNYHYPQWKHKPKSITWKIWSKQTDQWLRSIGIFNLRTPMSELDLESLLQIWKLAKLIAHDDMLAWSIENIGRKNIQHNICSGELIPLLNQHDLPATMRVIVKQSLNKLADNTSLSFHVACCAQFGRVECLKVLLKEGKFDINYRFKSSKNETALMISCSNLQCECIKLLISLGADVNLKDDDGKTALLHVLSLSSHTNEQQIYHSMKLLIKAQADLHVKDDHNNNAITVASLHGHGKCLKYLLKFIDPNVMNDHCMTAIHYALQCKPGKVVGYKIAQLLCDSGKMISYGNELFYAVSSNHLPCVSLALHFLNNDVNRFTQNQTPLMRAMKLKNDEIGELLLKNGALVNLSDAKAKTAASYLSTTFSLSVKSTIRCIRLLTQYGGSLEVEPLKEQVKNDTLFLHAIRNSSVNSSKVDIIEALLECGANINHQNSEGESGLIIASKSNPPNERIVDLLIKYGADVNLHDKDGYSAIMYAIMINSDAAENCVFNLLRANAFTSIRVNSLSISDIACDRFKPLFRSPLEVNYNFKTSLESLHSRITTIFG